MFFVRSYIGVQNGCGMFHFLQGYLCEINTQSITFGYCAVCYIGSNSLHGISSFKRLAAFVFVAQLDGIIDCFAFYNTGNDYIIYIYT